MEKTESFFKVKHLYSRAGFGISYLELQSKSGKSIPKLVTELISKAKDGDKGIVSVDKEETLAQISEAYKLRRKNDDAVENNEKRRTLMRLQNEKSKGINIEWTQKMIQTSSPLLEKMTLFWHGHFACRNNNPYYAQQLNNIQRSNAIGSFKTLLMEISKAPAMLQYLNNQQNRKDHPNENFARELMELFTLGIGNYTENDVKESARAFTGWSYNQKGDFVFRTQVHDDGKKVFLGKTGNFDGEDIIDIILEQPATAEFICRKLYLFFVNDEPNERHIKELATYFYKQKYNIAAVLDKMFKADWFYDKENVGNKIKSPAEFLITLSKTFFVNYQKPQVFIQLQTALGQYLFNPPNVAGWPGGKNWIDSSSLMLRMRIPSMILNNGYIDFNSKIDPDEEALIAINKKGKPRPVKSYINAEADWDKFLLSLPNSCSPNDLASYILQPDIKTSVKRLIDKDRPLKNIAIEMTSTPEYQLC